MTTHTYTPSGTCSRLIEIDMDGSVIADVRFLGGCNGNLKGIGALVKGLTPAQVIERIEGITCGVKPTSCPDQLARALRSIEVAG